LADVSLPASVSSDIIQETIDRLTDELREEEERLAASFTKDELREMRGVATVSDDINNETTQSYLEDKLAAIKLDTDHWKRKSQGAKEEGNDERSKLFDVAAKASALKEEFIRLKYDKRAETEEVQNIMREVIDDDPRTKFQKLKLWIKENMTTNVALISLSVASLSIAIYYGMKNTARGEAKAIKGFGKALEKIAKTGPVASALFTILSKIMQVGGSVFGFLANNLWILFLFILRYFLSYMRKRKSNQ
jgi:hypothetical protein